MSQAIGLEGLPAPVCATCGCEIEVDDQPCPARDEGVCYP